MLPVLVHRSPYTHDWARIHTFHKTNYFRICRKRNHDPGSQTSPPQTLLGGPVHHVERPRAECFLIPTHRERLYCSAVLFRQVQLSTSRCVVPCAKMHFWTCARLSLRGPGERARAVALWLCSHSRVMRPHTAPQRVFRTVPQNVL